MQPAAAVGAMLQPRIFSDTHSMDVRDVDINNSSPLRFFFWLKLNSCSKLPAVEFMLTCAILMARHVPQVRGQQDLLELCLARSQYQSLGNLRL